MKIINEEALHESDRLESLYDEDHRNTQVRAVGIKEDEEDSDKNKDLYLNGGRLYNNPIIVGWNNPVMNELPFELLYLYPRLLPKLSSNHSTVAPSIFLQSQLLMVFPGGGTLLQIISMCLFSHVTEDLHA